MQPFFLPTDRTQNEIAEQLGISTSALRKYLRNPGIMRLETYIDMVRLGIRVPIVSEFITCDACNGTGLVELVHDSEEDQ